MHGGWALLQGFFSVHFEHAEWEAIPVIGCLNKKGAKMCSCAGVRRINSVLAIRRCAMRGRDHRGNEITKEDWSSEFASQF